MLVQNSKGVFYRDYTIYKGKKAYYSTEKKRLPHQGKKECARRIRQCLKMRMVAN